MSDGVPSLDLVVDAVVVHSFPLQAGELVIGRAADADIRLVDNSVSNRHAHVLVEQSPDFPGVLEVTVKDAGSTNGTHVNGDRIDEQRLADGDEVRIGFTVLHYRDPQASNTSVTGFILNEDL